VYHDQLAHAFEKLSAGLREKVSFTPTQSLQSVSFHHVGLGKADMKVFDKLSHALHESVEVEFSYLKAGATKVEQRRVQPYHLANRENFWYLVGHDLDRGALRHFAVARMQSIAVTTQKFERPPDFSPEKHFGKSFGAFVGTGDFKVAIRFNADAAHRVKERFWHESQEIRDLRDGGIELKLQVNDLEEIARWVVSWGDEARAMAPKELVVQVRGLITRLTKHYRG